MANRENVANLCRVCMASSEDGITWQNIFTDTDSNAGKECLIFIIKEVTGNAIKPNDGLPERICPSCLQTAKIALKFKRRIEDSFHYSSKLMEQKIPTNNKEILSESLAGEHGYISIAIDEQEELKTLPSKPPFKCPICSKICTYRSLLKIHIRTHTGKMPFKCTYCLKSFNNKSAVSEHILSHRGERQRPFQCTECPKAFYQRTYLIEHMRTHTGEKPFKCSQCPKTFSHNNSLKCHLVTHTGERPFKCSQCSKTFSRDGGLRYHLKAHHRIKTPSVCKRIQHEDMASKKPTTKVGYNAQSLKLHEERGSFSDLGSN